MRLRVVYVIQYGALLTHCAPAAPTNPHCCSDVGNLSYSSDDRSVRAAFERFGELTDCFLPTDRETGRPRGFAFVTYADRKSADDASRELNETELDGRRIRVEVSKPRGSGGGGGGRGGYGGGGGGTLVEPSCCVVCVAGCAVARVSCCE